MLMKIGDITKKLGVSHRSLHYWEDRGIITSSREENDFRYYDEENQQKIRQILILRKLRLTLNQIVMVLESDSTKDIIDTLQDKLINVEDEINSLSTIREILDSFITKLNKNMMIDLKLSLLDDSAILEIVDSLTVSRPKVKNTATIKELENANEKLFKLTNRDIRIIYLPPMTVASTHIVGKDTKGNNAEIIAASIIDDFINKTNLKEIYPEARNFGFNNPDGIEDNNPDHGYERWVSIPADFEVPEPLVKKQLEGGMYAAFMIPIGAWDEGWVPLHNWVRENDIYDFRWETIDGVCGWIEEHLNYWEWETIKQYNGINQFDLLLPIKPRVEKSTK